MTHTPHERFDWETIDLFRAVLAVCGVRSRVEYDYASQSRPYWVIPAHKTKGPHRWTFRVSADGSFGELSIDGRIVLSLSALELQAC